MRLGGMIPSLGVGSLLGDPSPYLFFDPFSHVFWVCLGVYIFMGFWGVCVYTLRYSKGKRYKHVLGIFLAWESWWRSLIMMRL